MQPTTRVSPFGEVVIHTFRDDYRFLSNFYEGAPFVWQGHEFLTSEHAYQWAKTDDPIEQEDILFSWISPNGVTKVPTTPGQAKRAGAKATRRKGWDEIQTMREILYEKFSQNPEVRQKLIDTGDSLLIEGNTWCDNFWGRCICVDCWGKYIIGQNILGLLLMELREKLASDAK